MHDEPLGHLLVSAGPTYEPIDAVRFLGNRSSGRLGVALAEAARREGWRVTLLLGPTSIEPTDTGVEVHRFRTTADLQGLLADHFPACDMLVMAAAVADYRPVIPEQARRDPLGTKLKRSGEGLKLEFEATPDLLAGCSAMRRPGQRIVGFALEPAERLIDSARSKLERKGVDAIVANPLETMDSGAIDATLISRDGTSVSTPGPIAKSEFASCLLERLGAVCALPEPA